MYAVEAVNLTKYYGNAKGIENLNLTVTEGEFFGFIGPNGAGKSTTIRTLLGLLQKSGGEGKIFGKDIVTQKNEILKEVGYLPAEAVFYRNMRVKDILKLSANLRRTDCTREASELCERLNLDPAKKVDELSFGNRKKVGIICALLHKPRLCILDEPTSGLDPFMQREFFEILKERHKAGATVFLSSHILSEVQHNCTRAAVIRGGSIIACDSVEALSKTNAKRVRVQGAVDISTLPDTRDIQQSDSGISFLYGGDINLLLQTLAQQSVRDLSIDEPDLEEIFMHYYADGGAEK
ncbi:MAG: ATP-binding cassette domain-containing protein [Candidatus Fimenecus sp.]